MIPPDSEPIGSLLKEMTGSFPDRGTVTDSVMAKRLGISPAAYSNYKEGKRVPSKQNAWKMAKLWARHRKLSPDSSPVRQMVARLTRAHSHENRAFFPLLARNEIELRVNTLSLGVFATFFQAVFRQYAAEAGIRVHQGERASSEKLQEDFGSGQTHVALGIFDAVARFLWARFLPLFPLRISLSSIGLFSSTGGSMAKEVCTLSLALSRSEGSSNIRYRPLVVAGGVGEQHCLNTLGVSTNDLERETSLEPEPLAAKLRKMKRELAAAGDDQTVPVLVCDEYTCIRVLKELKREGRLLFPLTTRQTVRQIPVRQDLPRYRVSVAVGRNQVDFYEFLRESLTTFMGRQFHAVANEAAKLYFGLEKEVQAAAPYMYQWSLDARSTPAVWVPGNEISGVEAARLAREYSRYALRLDSHSIQGATAEVATWVPFLHRVREIVLAGATRSKIVYYDAANPSSATETQVQRLIKQLAAKFLAVGATTSAIGAEDWKSLSDKFGGANGRILLVREDADESGSTANYVGMLGVTSSNIWHTATGGPVCQLRYLWVNPMSQGESIGRVLIQEGIQYAAREMKANTVYAEVSPALESAIALFREAGFRASRQSPESDDRLLFEFSVIGR